MSRRVVFNANDSGKLQKYENSVSRTQTYVFHCKNDKLIFLLFHIYPVELEPTSVQFWETCLCGELKDVFFFLLKFLFWKNLFQFGLKVYYNSTRELWIVSGRLFCSFTWTYVKTRQKQQKIKKRNQLSKFNFSLNTIYTCLVFIFDWPTPINVSGFEWGLWRLFFFMEVAAHNILGLINNVVFLLNQSQTSEIWNFIWTSQ